MAHRTTASRHALLAVGLLAVAILTGCTSPAPPPAPLPSAAEPALAPPPSQPPVGQVVAVGSLPEGVVADPVTHVVVVGVRQPDGLVLLDDRSGHIVGRVPLPGHLRHLQLAGPGGPVLVPDESSDSLLTVALPAGTVIGRVRTGVSPHDATAAGNGLVFVANEAGASVAVVRGSTVVHTFTDVVQPAGVAAVGDLVAVVDVRQNALHIYDAARLQVVGDLAAGAGPTHAVADRQGRVAVIDTRGNAVLLYQLTPTGRQLDRLPLPGVPYGVAYDSTRDLLWVTLTARDQVVAVALGGTAPRVVARLPTVRQPNTVAVDSATGRVFVTGTSDGVLQIIDPPAGLA